MIQWTTITNVSLKKLYNYKRTFAVLLFQPTMAPSAKAAREKQKVSGIGEHKVAFTHVVSHIPCCIVCGPWAAYVHLKEQMARFPIIGIQLKTMEAKG